MAKMVEITCACGCRRKRLVRAADRARGWGRFYDKSCKAREQERRTGQHADYLHRTRYEETEGVVLMPGDMSSDALGQW